MDLQEAKELRQELEAIEGAMQRIKTLWKSRNFPCLDDIEDLGKSLSQVEGCMDSIIDKRADMPAV